MSPVYDIEWRQEVPDEDDRIIRTQQRGSTPEKAIQNALNGAGGVSASEVEGWDAPRVRELDEDGGYAEGTIA